MRERLIELILNAPKKDVVYGNIKLDKPVQTAQTVADYLLANGVIVPLNKPVGLMPSNDEMNTDVYCPYCETNLSGLYGEEPPQIITCYHCGEFLDNTKIITREAAEEALMGSKQE